MSAPEPALEARLSIEVGPSANRFVVEAELSLASGVLVLFGPSGAGKSLTLGALAGLVHPTRGLIRVSGESLYDSERKIDVKTHKRKLGYVPQHHSLFPFLDVTGNVAFGLPRSERNKNPMVPQLLEDLGLTHLASSKPASLSGGERQRVALARALAVRPRLLLLDEPFASIDQEGRVALRKTLREVLNRYKTPAVLVTHDPEEALALGDTLVRFERGRTTTSGTPASLLGRGQPVMVTGKARSVVESLGEGRGAIVLEDARVEGPSELLSPGEDGHVTIELRTWPRGRRRDEGAR